MFNIWVQRPLMPSHIMIIICVGFGVVGPNLQHHLLTFRGFLQFRPLIALCTDLSRITTELWEIPVFSPADGALILHMITQHYFFDVIFFPFLEREPCKRVMRKACCVRQTDRQTDIFIRPNRKNTMIDV